MQELIDKLRQFARERDWERYHSPKNLAMALSVEVADIRRVILIRDYIILPYTENSVK